MDGAAVDFAERAALLEFSGGLSRAAAESQALREIADLAEPPPGIVGELIAAAARCRHVELHHALVDAGLTGRRGPLWGIGSVVTEADTYRPVVPGELGAAAIIVPAGVDGLDDLVAQDLTSRRLYSRLGIADVVGGGEIEWARTSGRPLLIFPDVVTWLRAGCRGIVVVDWARAGHALDGAPALLTTKGLASRVRTATRRCFPQPIVAVPQAPGGIADAA